MARHYNKKTPTTDENTEIEVSDDGLITAFQDSPARIRNRIIRLQEDINQINSQRDLYIDQLWEIKNNTDINVTPIPSKKVINW